VVKRFAGIVNDFRFWISDRGKSGDSDGNRMTGFVLQLVLKITGQLQTSRSVAVREKAAEQSVFQDAP
jgi:hypothetical protein